MKKKIIFALLLAGISFLAPNVADAQENERLAGPIDCRGYCVPDYNVCALTADGKCPCAPKGCI